MSTDIDFGILLGLAYGTFVDEMRADLARRGFDDLGRSYGYVFRVLGDSDRSLSELAGLLGMTLPGAGKIVDEMEARGYVERHPDRSDRRVKWLALSRRGRAALRLPVPSIATTSGGWRRRPPSAPRSRASWASPRMARRRPTSARCEVEDWGQTPMLRRPLASRRVHLVRRTGRRGKTTQVRSSPRRPVPPAVRWCRCASPAAPRRASGSGRSCSIPTPGSRPGRRRSSTPRRAPSSWPR